MTVREKFPHDKALEIPNVYKTDRRSPSRASPRFASRAIPAVAGDVDVITHDLRAGVRRLSPAPGQDARGVCRTGWSTVAAFQTRNPIHRSHEYLTKCAWR